MAQNSTQPKVDVSVVESYVKDAITAGFSNKSIPDYPQDFSMVAKSTFYKEVIREVVKELGDEFKAKDTSNVVVKTAWDEVEKAKNLIEFRKSFRLYLVALRANLYTEEDIEEYTNMIDDLDREVRQLQEYKRIYNEMFGILTQGDRDLNTLLQSNKMKDSGFIDVEICRVLGIERTALSRLRKRVIIQKEEN